MGEQEMFLRTIQDLEAIEHVPLAERLNVHSTYELIRKAATKDPERTAISLLLGGEQADRPVCLSYRALLSSIHQTANLLADLGMGPQDVIALLLPDLLETQVLLWGGQAAGIVCPIPPWLPAQQIVDLLQAAKAKLLVVAGPQMSQELWQKTELVRGKVKSITMVLQVRGPGKERDTAYAFDALIEDYPDDRLHTGREIALDDLAVYFPSRGTTDTLGLVPLSHGNLLYAAWALGLPTTFAPEEVLLGGLSRCIQGCWWRAAGS
jgi:fatty-acyl-CoA synthase